MSTFPARLELEDGRILPHAKNFHLRAPETTVEYRAYTQTGGLKVIASRDLYEDGSEEILVSVSHSGGFRALAHDIMLVGKLFVPEGGFCTVTPGPHLPHVTIIRFRVGDVIPGETRTMHIDPHLINNFPDTMMHMDA